MVKELYRSCCSSLRFIYAISMRRRSEEGALSVLQKTVPWLKKATDRKWSRVKLCIMLFPILHRRLSALLLIVNTLFRLNSGFSNMFFYSALSICVTNVNRTTDQVFTELCWIHPLLLTLQQENSIFPSKLVKSLE